MPRYLIAHSGHAYATADIYTGLVAGLQANGVTVLPFHLQTRLDRAGSWLYHNWRRIQRTTPDFPRPSHSEILYQAAMGLVEMALRELPDWVIAVSGSAMHPDALIMLRRAGAPLAILLTESPYEDDPQKHLLSRVAAAESGAPFVVFTNERASVATLRSVVPTTYYLPHAYDPDRHFPGAGADDSEATPPLKTPSSLVSGTPSTLVQAHDVVFVGSPFPERVELLSAVDWTGIDLGLYGEWSRVLPSRHRLRPFIRSGPIDNRLTAALYRRAKIGLNLYRQSVTARPDSPRFGHGESLNPRAYELAACGAFHLSEPRAELVEVFGGIVPAFRDAAELSAQIRHYLNAPEERERHARALPECVAGQTWTRRAKDLLERLPVPAQVETPVLAAVS